MAKIFGYSKKEGKDWFKTDAYSDKEIESIKDPEGGSQLSMPTAIPSPFARLDLVKSAFRDISQSKNLKHLVQNGDVIASLDSEKLVSDSLDLAELMFNIDSVSDDLRIIPWEKKEQLTILKSSNDMHRRLAETLELYLDQDKDSYNFDTMDSLFIIEYKHIIIGCTSPVTLFFTTANDLSGAQLKLTGNDTLFDNEYASLYERDSEFQKYIYSLFYAHPILSKKMNYLFDYLEKNLGILQNNNYDLYKEIKSISKNSYDKLYSELDTGISNNPVTVLGIELKKRKLIDLTKYISENSDFRIYSSKFNQENKPLVLQNGFSKSWTYAKDTWRKIDIPYFSDKPLSKRTLPGTSIEYPFLTVSDFLEPYIVRLIYPINKNKYFDGNLIINSGDDLKGYLMPLKPKFFEFFNASDLYESKPNCPEISVSQNIANSIKVKLKIPVSKSNEYIVLERTYYDSSANQFSKPDLIANKGAIMEQQVGVTIFPFIKFNDSEMKSKYRVQLIDRDISEDLMKRDYDLRFYSNDRSDDIKTIAKKVRSKKELNSGATSQYYILEEEFDFVQISNGITSGIIIPKWKPYNKGHELFSFAIDFGTTNTHIEYKIGNNLPRPFDINKEDIQIASLFDPDKTSDDFSGTGAIAIRELIEHEFIPFIIGNNSDFELPQRTVISENMSLDISTETYTLADFNIPFTYEKKFSRDKIHSNLKWANKQAGNSKRIESFFEEIIMLMRNKVLFNGGDLSKTELIWFYPSSMTRGRKGELESAWKKLFKEYFNSKNVPKGITESLAPFHYFKNQIQGGGISKPVISIDIGGGTTDIVVFKGGIPLVLSSFKFAGNALFGDGFSDFGAADKDGMISKYLPHFEKLLNANKRYDLIQVLSSIKENSKTEDINSFFFSIENNAKISDNGMYSYNNLLAKDEDFKILFIYFYYSIIYHVAEIIKVNDIELPKDLIFSGTGSKILNIISSDFELLSEFSKIIFESVCKKQYDSSGLSIRLEEEKPKEVTSKGGLMQQDDNIRINLEEIKVIHNGFQDDNNKVLSYSDLDNTLLSSAVEHIEGFNRLLLEANSKLNFNHNFNVSPKSFDIFKQELNRHIRDYLIQGIENSKKLDEINDNENELGETVFFYPMIGLINNLLKELSILSPINS